jgi:dipeptidyl aminopeptidase/acylaminoacyl peptidase
VGSIDISCLYEGSDCRTQPKIILNGKEPDVSSGGALVAFVWDGGNPPKDGRQHEKIYVARLDDLTELRLISGDLLDCSVPAWSPDDTQIAFVCSRNIFISDPDGSNLLNLTRASVGSEWAEVPHWWNDFDPKWSPDGSRVSFIGVRVQEEYALGYCDDAVTNSLYFVDPDGRNLTHVDPPDDVSLLWHNWNFLADTRIKH